MQAINKQTKTKTKITDQNINQQTYTKWTHLHTQIGEFNHMCHTTGTPPYQGYELIRSLLPQYLYDATALSKQHEVTLKRKEDRAYPS